MRQHVNPLSRFFQLPKELPDPCELFENDDLPIHLDIGSARGKFLINSASINPHANYLGVEIREKLVLAAEKERSEIGLKNLCFLFCNANVSLDEWLLKLPQNKLNKVTIQFPDPWFKRRHYKRRVLQPSLLLAIAKALLPGRQIFIQSDSLDVIKPMVELIQLTNCFDGFKESTSPWIDNNPMPIPSERELYAMNNNLHIHRALFIRNKNHLPDLSFLIDR